MPTESSREPFDPPIEPVLRSVLDGRRGQAEAIAELTTDFDGSPDEWMEQAAQRRSEITELTVALQEEASAIRVAVVTDLLAASAGTVSDSLAGMVMLLGGIRLAVLKEPGAAFDLYEKAAPLLSDDPDYFLTCRRLTAGLLAKTRRYAEFDDISTAVIEMAERRGDNGELFMALLDKAASMAMRSRAADAVSAASTALTIREGLTDSSLRVPGLVDQATVLIRLGDYSRKAGDFRAAIAYLEQARAAASDPFDAAYALSEIGYTWRMLGETSRGDHLLEQAAREAEAIGATGAASYWRGEAADVGTPTTPASPGCVRTRCSRDGAPDPEVIKLLNHCIREARNAGDLTREADARNNLAVALSRLDQPLRADVTSRLAIATAEQLGDELRQIQFRVNLASFDIGRGRRDEALSTLAPALAVGEELRRRTTSTELRQSVSVTLGVAYDLATIAAAVPFKPGRWMVPEGTERVFSVPEPAAVLELGQRARASNLLEWLRVGQIVEESGDADLVAAMLELRAAETAVEMAAAESAAIGAPAVARDTAAEQFEAAAAAAGSRCPAGSSRSGCPSWRPR